MKLRSRSAIWRDHLCRRYAAGRGGARRASGGFAALTERLFTVAATRLRAPQRSHFDIGTVPGVPLGCTERLFTGRRYAARGPRVSKAQGDAFDAEPWFAARPTATQARFGGSLRFTERLFTSSRYAAAGPTAIQMLRDLQPRRRLIKRFVASAVVRCANHSHLSAATRLGAPTATPVVGPSRGQNPHPNPLPWGEG